MGRSNYSISPPRRHPGHASPFPFGVVSVKASREMESLAVHNHRWVFLDVAAVNNGVFGAD